MAWRHLLYTPDALGIIKNNLAKDNEKKKILMLQDSFGWFLSTYIATDIAEVDMINLSVFDGSLHRYIEETKPDAVVLLLCERNIRPIEWESHTDYFDFR